MQIETKFDIGDFVWFLNGTGVSRLQVSTINIQLNPDETFITYFFNAGDIDSMFSSYEEGCFSTKQELLDSL